MLLTRPSSLQNMEWGEGGGEWGAREERGKQTGGRSSGGQKPSAQTDPTVFNFNQLYARPLFILPLFLSLCQSLLVSLFPSLSVFLCLHNNGLFVMQEASSTSIIPTTPPPTLHHCYHHLVLRCNKYGNEQEPVIGNFKLGSLVLKKDTNVLIASSWRNPIFCGHWLQNWWEQPFPKSYGWLFGMCTLQQKMSNDKDTVGDAHVHRPCVYC